MDVKGTQATAPTPTLNRAIRSSQTHDLSHACQLPERLHFSISVSPTASIEWSRTVDDHHHTTSISNSSPGPSARALTASIADRHSGIPQIRSSQVRSDFISDRPAPNSDHAKTRNETSRHA